MRERERARVEMERNGMVRNNEMEWATKKDGVEWNGGVDWTGVEWSAVEWSGVE